MWRFIKAVIMFYKPMLIVYTIGLPFGIYNWWPVMFPKERPVGVQSATDLYYKAPVQVSPRATYSAPVLVHGQGGYRYSQFWLDVETLSPDTKSLSEYSYLKIWLKKTHDEHGTNGARRDRAFRDQDVTEYVDCLRMMGQEWKQVRVRDRKGNYMIFTVKGEIWRCYGNRGRMFRVD